jgi:arginase
MEVQLIQIPYDSSHRYQRMGGGPTYLVEHGLEQALQAQGHQTLVTQLFDSRTLPVEIATTFTLNHELATEVQRAVAQGRFPLVLSGNCDHCVGTLAGVKRDPIGIIWFDGHGDFNTPETTISGFLDGMGLAMATGRCWRNMTSAIPGFRPVPDDQVILVGTRDLDPDEQRLLDESAATIVWSAAIQQQGVAGALEPVLDALAQRVKEVYLHFDMDTLDPLLTPSNHLVPPEGLTIEQAVAAIRAIKARFTLAAAALTAYDPTFDPERKTLPAIFRLAEVLLEPVEAL